MKNTAWNGFFQESIRLKRRGSLSIPQELPPFFNGSYFPEKTANSERP
jgi:hypothetical protein